jgi:hypothetical protein
MMTTVRVSLLLVWLAACGGGGKHTEQADAGDDGNEQFDMAVDAKPPNVTHLGTVQAVRVGAGGTSTLIGFYDVPSTAPGCTWTYAGSCSLQTCATSSGLVADSAGAITLAVGTTQGTSTPTGTTYPGVALPALDPGTTFSASAAGSTVPAFNSASIIVPAMLGGVQPPDMTAIMKSQPLDVSWTPVDGRFYVNISQQGIGTPYPAAYAQTLRCTGSTLTGGVTIDPSLLSPFDTSMQATLSIAALASDDVTAGDYDVTVRVLILDVGRKVSFQ